MKTKKNALYRIFFLLAMTLAFTSCEYVGLGIEFGNGSYDYRERTDYLCSRVWVDEWYDDYDVYHYQELRFYPDNTGEDYLLHARPLREPGRIESGIRLGLVERILYEPPPCLPRRIFVYG